MPYQEIKRHLCEIGEDSTPQSDKANAEEGRTGADVLAGSVG